VLEVGHVWVGLAVKTVEPVDLTVVEQLGNDSGDVVGWDTSSNVLAVSSSTGSGVVLVNTGLGDRESDACKVGVPGDGAGRVVGTVDVVVVQNNLLVGGGNSTSGVGSSRGLFGSSFSRSLGSSGRGGRFGCGRGTRGLFGGSGGGREFLGRASGGSGGDFLGRRLNGRRGLFCACASGFFGGGGCLCGGRFLCGGGGSLFGRSL